MRPGGTSGASVYDEHILQQLAALRADEWAGAEALAARVAALRDGGRPHAARAAVQRMAAARVLEARGVPDGPPGAFAVRLPPGRADVPALAAAGRDRALAALAEQRAAMRAAAQAMTEAVEQVQGLAEMPMHQPGMRMAARTAEHEIGRALGAWRRAGRRVAALSRPVGDPG